MGQERVDNPKHPTQKPVKLLKHLIKIASNENDIVLDPFMGVGSTGIAALEMNRRFIGIEIEKEYFEAAKKRLQNTEINQKEE
jgi:site-specific DNA-methyltransferase (adenine-specific)/modification methylase